jgi:hypothetical protein
VNPYYVARQLERTNPDAKNSLINWLDLHEQGLPSAFQKHLGTRAADCFKEIDVDETLPKQKNRLLLALIALSTLGLAILLLLGPAAFLASMLRAFAPLYTPPDIARTHITLLQPAAGDAEVSATQAVTFAAKIEGRVPASNRPDAPRLLYRYQSNDDYFTQALQSEADGTWTAPFPSAELRTGFFYRIAAGDTETSEHQIQVRARAHVQRFEVTYHYRPYLQRAKKTMKYPNKTAAVPIIHGLRGTEVELLVHASRPVKKASVEIESNGVKKSLPIRILADDAHAFACRWTLEQPGHFRIAFTSIDDEANLDRDDYRIDVRDDEAPTVVLTNPGKDVALPENGILELEGLASDDVGVKSLALHLRILTGSDKPKLRPKIYRPDKSFQFENGTYPEVIDYKDFLALDDLKDDKGTRWLLRPGTVVEYWLEATDNADYPHPTGNVGKSLSYKITLLPALKDAKVQSAQRQDAQKNQKQHQQEQDKKLGKKNDERTQNPSGAGGEQSLQDQMNNTKNRLDQDKKKIDEKMKGKNPQEKRGGAKDADPKNSEAKNGPSDSTNAPQPKSKDEQPKTPDDGGKQKDQGDGQGKSGETKGEGSEDKTQESPSKGQGKDKGEAKGLDQNGPETPNKDAAMNPKQPPNPQAKGTKADPETNIAEPKPTPPEQAKDAGKTRDDASPKAQDEPTWGDLAKLLEKLAKHDENSDGAGEAIAKIGKQTEDSQKAELAKDVLAKNGRDPGTGKGLKKSPNPYGGSGASPGIADDVKAAAANREFARRIAQMQLDDWKKNVTPDVLKKAGLSEADWQRFVKNAQVYDALVRQWNTQLAKKQINELRGRTGAPSGSGPRAVDATGIGGGPLDARYAPTPPELRDAQDRFTRP